ncbi:MAG: M23 family metallopeptidase [Myxococcales bacterium]|nr:M23 family metallopeptidase [Myxococcales bacterium]
MKVTHILVGISLAACLTPRGLLAENPGERVAISRTTIRHGSSVDGIQDSEKKDKIPGSGTPSQADSWRVADLKPLSLTPVPGVESSGYGWRQDPVRRRKVKFHKGRDYRAPKGTPVYAAGAGTVVFAGRQTGYGRVIYVDHGDGLSTRYAHLSAFDAKKGSRVAAGDQIGKVGATGRATGNHLHFEVRIDGRAIDPVIALRIAGLQRTEPDQANKLVVELAPDVQGDLEDEHSPPPTARRGRAAAKAASHRPARKANLTSRSDKRKATAGGSGARVW